MARMTVRQAVQELRSEGLVVAQHGRGVFVRPTPPIRRLASDRFARQHRAEGKAAFTVEAEISGYSPQVDNIAVSLEKPNPSVAERLRVSADDDVVVRSRRYLANGRPVETAVSYIPAALPKARRSSTSIPGPAASTPVSKKMGTHSPASPRKSQRACPLPMNDGCWNLSQEFPS